MKIIVTGASGFIGGEITLALARTPFYEIVALGRRDCNRFSKLDNVTYIKQDLNEINTNWTADVCIHCAGYADTHGHYVQFYENNVSATKCLIKNIQCNKIIYISSSSVYDFRDNQVKSENDANIHSALSHYGKTKLLAEKVVLASKINSKIVLRPRAVYGLNDTQLMPRINKLFLSRFLIVPGRLSSRTSLTHIDLLVQVVLRSIHQKIKGSQIFNVADDEVYRLEKILESIGIANRGKKHIKLVIPQLVLILWIKLVRLLKIRSAINSQSLSYLWDDSILDISKMRKAYQVDFYKYSFDSFINDAYN